MLYEKVLAPSTEQQETAHTYVSVQFPCVMHIIEAKHARLGLETGQL